MKTRSRIPHSKTLKGYWFKAFAAAVSLALFLSASFTTAFFWSIFLVWWAFRFDSRMPAAAALLFLVIIPNLLALGRDVAAENLAVYAFFLLCITVALQIIELVRDEGAEKAAKNDMVLDLRNHNHEA